MAEKKYKKVVRTLDDSKFVLLGRGDLSSKAQNLYDNLWGMFGLDQPTRAKIIAGFEKRGVPKHEWPSVSDYAWTKEVEDAFYNHPKHRTFVNKAKAMRGMTWGLWVLDSEPALLDEYDKPTSHRYTAHGATVTDDNGTVIGYGVDVRSANLIADAMNAPNTKAQISSVTR